MDVGALTAALETLVLEHLPEGRFCARGVLPEWCLQLRAPELRGQVPFAIESVFGFLGSFLESAQRAWQDAPSARAASGFWTEWSASAGEIHLEAQAVRLGKLELLLISRNERGFEQQQLMLQRARELRLAHTALLRQIEQKDVLFHAIVHDLASPLHSILGMLSLLSERPLRAPGAEWVRSALQAATRQKQLIAEILEVFSLERDPLPACAEDGGDEPDVREAIERAVKELEPIAQRKNVAIEVTPCAAAQRVAVRGERRRLARVLENLVDRGLRNSSPGGTVRIAVRSEGCWVSVVVEDRGPPVPIERLPQLFEKFAPGREPDAAGRSLGLYFCRITVERWGGGIGCELGELGGPKFWVRLPAAESACAERGRSLRRR